MQVETIDSAYSTVKDTFFSHWVVGLNGNGFGIPCKYVYTSSGRKLDTKDGRILCEELELTWKYLNLGKVITLSPECKGIFQDLKALKVISPEVSEDILLAEAVFAHNSKLKNGIKLSPFQLVKGKQSEPPLVDDTEANSQLHKQVKASRGSGSRKKEWRSTGGNQPTHLLNRLLGGASS